METETFRRTAAVVAPAAFLAAILAANHVTTTYGLIPVGFGLVATAGTYLAGLTFVLRDWTQDQLGRATRSRWSRKTGSRIFLRFLGMSSIACSSAAARTGSLVRTPGRQSQRPRGVASGSTWAASTLSADGGTPTQSAAIPWTEPI